jgi:hypothetical protein
MDSINAAVVEALLKVLGDKGGFDNWWGGIDSDIQEEIKQDLVAALKQSLAQPEQEPSIEDRLVMAYAERDKVDAAAYRALQASQPSAPVVPEGFNRQDMLDVAESLRTEYPQHLNQGNIAGIGDYLLETAPAFAARLIETLLNAAPTPPTEPQRN